MKKSLGLVAAMMSIFSAAFLPKITEAAITCSAISAVPVAIKLYTSGTAYLRYRTNSASNVYLYAQLPSITTAAGIAIADLASDAITSKARVDIVMTNTTATVCPSINAALVGTVTSLAIDY